MARKDLERNYDGNSDGSEYDITDTFNMLFGERSEDDAADEQAQIRSEIAEIETAIEAEDWRTLERLGLTDTEVVGTEPGPEGREFTRRVLRSDVDEKLADLRRLAAMTPAEFAAYQNEQRDRLLGQ